MVYHYDQDGNPTSEETVYVQTPDAPHKNFTSGRRPFSSTLENADTVWSPVDSIPDDADFIGAYNLKKLPQKGAA